MTHQHHPSVELSVDRYAKAVVARLNAGTDELPYDISERLRAARERAVAQRLRVRTAQPVVAVGGSAAALGADEGLTLWSRLASALPLVALVAGLVAIQIHQDERRASELAEVDAALLSDDLPPAAYADAGFVQFLKSGEH